MDESLCDEDLKQKFRKLGATSNGETSFVCNLEPRDPLCQAISQVLPDEWAGRTLWARYSDRDDFSRLWRAADNGCTIEERLVVIIWDETPSDTTFDPISTDRHLSPLEWAFCAKSRNSNLQVFILDLAPKTHAILPSYRLVQSLKETVIPWIRVVPLHDIHRCIPNLFEFISRIIPDQPSVAAADLLREVRFHLTDVGQEENRHAITNMVGGIVLTGPEHFQQKDSIHARPLQTLFEATGLVSAGAAGIWSIPKLVGPQKIILVDDQAGHGWFDWLRETVDCCEIENIWDKDQPITVLQERFAREMGRIKDPHRDLRFQMSLSETSTPNSREVLLLDIRLFLRADVSEEAHFYKNLLMFAEYFRETENPAWQNFTKLELEEIRAWCESNTTGPSQDSTYSHNTQSHYLALTLFPRLLALLDLSYPVILFSSTGQRAILDRLRPYGNIITAFEKPRFFGANPMHLRSDTYRRLQDAFDKANAMLRVRRKCQYVTQLSSRLPHAGREEAPDPPFDAMHVELYVDESGQAPHAVGGCFAVWALHTDQTETRESALVRAQHIADAFEDDLVLSGVRYFDNSGIGPSSPTVLPKLSSCAQQLNKALTTSNNRPTRNSR